MKKIYSSIAAIFFLAQILQAQPCPPPGFPDSGNTCPEAPVLCDNIDGYCNTINNNNVPQPFPGCSGQWTLNNDEWFAFYAATTTITIVVTPSDCTSNGNNQGMQGGIYHGCGGAVMDVQCACTENPFTLTATNYVIGDIYWFVLDGCGGDVCDYTIDVTAGSTVPAPPEDPGNITGPSPVCGGTTTSYSVPNVVGASFYTWTLNPSGMGSMNGGNDESVNVVWNTTANGLVELCLAVANQCFPNPDTVCKTIEVIPRPTATLSGSGVLCQGQSPPDTVYLTVTFTGEAPWVFTPTLNGSPQTPITTSDNPYTLAVTQAGNWGITNLHPVGLSCQGTVSGNVNITSVNMTLTNTSVASVCGQNNGSIDLSVSGGNAPYTYIWSNGATTQDLTSIPGGTTYTVTVTDNNGCTKTRTVSLNDNQITINLSATTTPNTVCNANNNGGINLTVSPNGSYTYMWSNGATTEDLTNQPPGTYTVTVTSGVNCTATGSYTIADQPNAPNASATSIQSTCGQDNGSINLSANGGVAPYTFSWSNGATTEDLNNIPAGDYSVTVTGANGCTDDLTVTVGNNNPPINLSATVVANTLCNGTGNGSINLTIQPNGSYTINWSNGATTEDLSNLLPGTYSVTVTTGLTCTASADYTVPDQPNAPNATFSTVQSTCGLSNGSINLSVSGGVSPYTFSWSNGSTTEDLSNIPAGDYSVTVTGANGCTDVADVTLGNNNPPINLTATVIANTNCNGNGNGSINLSVSPNNSYTFEWSNGATTEDLSNLQPGNYSVTVTTGLTCTATADFNVPDQPNNPNATYTTVQSTCDLANGSINLSVSGGVPPYTFLWSNGATTEDLSNIVAGNYSVTVTGANGCTDEADVTVSNNNPPINVTANVLANTNCNGTGNGSINVTVSPNGSYTFVWSNGATTEDLNNLLPGDYSVTVTGQGSCTETANFTVGDNPLEPNLSATITNTTCDLPNGGINVSVSGGAAPYTYLWSNGSTSQDLTGIIAGDYSITVTGANGCTDQANYTVNNSNPPINVTATIVPNTVCNGVFNGSISISIAPPGNFYTFLWSNGSISQNINGLAPGTYTVTVTGQGSCTETAEFDVPEAANVPNVTTSFVQSTCDLPNGSVSISVSGSVPPYTFMWSNGSSAQNQTGLLAGSYEVTVTGSNGCSTIAQIDLPNFNPPFSLSASLVHNTTCNGGNGSINLSVSPNGSYTYLWSNGSTSQDLNNLPPGDYSVTVSAGGSCIESETFTIDDNPNVPVLSFTHVNANCGLSNGSINLSVTGSLTPYVYSWSNGATTQDINAIPGDIYVVTVTGGNGCSTVDGVVVDDIVIPVNIDAFVNDVTSCTNNNGSISLTVTPSNATVTWDNGSHNLVRNNLPVGNYSVTVSAGGTCTETANFEVYENVEYPALSTDITPGYCSISNGSIDLTVMDGQTPYTYRWSTNATSQDLNNLASGTYTVTVTTALGCSAETTVFVPNNDIPILLNGVVNDNLSCVPPLNGSIDLVVDPTGYNYTYSWSNGSSSQNLANLAPGTYTVIVRLGTSCSATDSYVVLNAAVSPSLAVSGLPAICGLSNGGADLTVTGATSPYSYHWSTNASTQDLSNVLPGSYSVTVTDFYDCTATTTVLVGNNNVALNISGNVTDNTSCSVVNGAVDISVAPAGTYVYNWSNSSASQDLTSLPAGSYTVTVSAGTSCSSTATFGVNNNTSDPVIDPVITAAICTNPNGAIDLTVTGAQTPYVYNWSNSASTQDITGLLPGTYTVTVTGANGCTADTILFVPNFSSTFSLAGNVVPLTDCATPNGNIDLTVTPAGPYTYQWSNGPLTQDVSGLPAGIYTVSVTETGTCTASISFIVPNDQTFPATAQTVVAELCDLQNGSIDLSVTGGVTPYSYLWSNASVTEDLTNIQDGQYIVTITGANNCTTTATANVPDNSVSFSLGATPQANTSCVVNNGMIDLSVNPVTPGSGLNYTYVWSNLAQTQDLANLAAGNYIVTVSAGGSCINTADYTIQNDTEAPIIAEAVTAAFCGQSSGGVDVTVSGGQAPYSYNWSTNSNLEDLSGVTSGSYSVTVTGGNGCTSVDVYQVPENTIIPSVVGATTPNTSCVSNNGSIGLSVTPALTYTYLWGGGQTTASLQNIPGGNYIVTVSAGGACTAQASFNVPSDVAIVSLSGSTTNIACFGNTTGAIDLTVNGATPPLVHTWSNIPGNVEDLSGLAAGVYNVTVTDVNGCSSSATFNITQPANSLQITCNHVSDISTPTSTDGAGSVNIAGGTAPYTVDWNPGGIQNNVIPGVFNVTNLNQGNYQVTVTDANGCPAQCDFNIGLVPCTTSIGTMGNSLITLCGPGCITATYNNLGQFLDPNDALQFILHEGNGNQIVNEIARSSQPKFCFNQSTMDYGTTYYISAVAGNADPGGNVIIGAYCTVISAPTPILFSEIPVANVAPAPPIDCATPIASLVGSSSLPGVTFNWSTSNGQFVGSTSQPIAKVSTAGTYTMVINLNGCKDTASVSVQDIRNAPVAKIAATPDDILDCIIDEITLLGTAEGTFNANVVWISQGNVYTPGTVLQIQDPGTYQFVILDTLTHCSDTAILVVNENLVYPPLTINPPGVLTCNNPNVTLTGGSLFPGIQYQWATIAGADTTILGTGTSLTVSNAGTYWLLGLDPVNSCKNGLSVAVTADQTIPVAEAGTGFELKCFGETATLDGTASNHIATITFLWTTSNGNLVSGANTPTPLISKPGTYRLLVTDPASGCTDSDEVVIDPIDPTATATVTQPPCYGDKGSIIVDEVIGGQPPVKYSLNDGPFTTQSVFTNLAPGPYTVVIQDAEGCSTTLSAVLIEPDEFQIIVTPEVKIELGETYEIIALVNVPQSEIQSIVWTPSTGLSCDSCLHLFANPVISTQYKVQVTTDVGCRDDATVRFIVDRQIDVYIPNVFSPNNDGENDRFTVYANMKYNGVSKIHYLQVYSRWGELLWERENFLPNIDELGWDGKYKGQDMNPAVFVYQAMIEFSDGRKELFKGDVTIKR